MSGEKRGRVLLKVLKFIWSSLHQENRSKTFFISFLLILNSILDLAGLSLLLPLFNLILNDDFIEKNELIKSFYDTLGFSTEVQFIVFTCVLVLLVFLIKNFTSLWIVKKQTVFAMSTAKDMALRIHEIYYSRGYDFFKEHNANDLVFNMNVATIRYAQTLVLGMLNFLNELLIIIIIVLSIAIYNPSILLLLCCSILPVFAFFYMKVRKMTKKMGDEVKEFFPKLSKDFFQSIYGYKDVTISGSNEAFRNKISKSLTKMVDVNTRRNVLNLAPTKVIEIALIGAVCLVVIYGVTYLDSKAEIVNILGLLVIAGYRILPSLNRIMIALMGFQENTYIIEMLKPLLIEEAQEKKKQIPIEFDEKISLRNVSFAFKDEPDQLVLDDLSIDILKGEVIGLIGESGSGKTTIMQTLLSFYKPNKGALFLDEVEVSEETLKDYYEKVGYVEQYVYLMDCSLAENVAFGVAKKDIDLSKVKEVLERASLTEFYQNLPAGLDTELGENGVKLSGGQRQRIGIARALYRDVEILYFDEATSALDEETENEITKSIDALNDGSLTIVIIAHRLTTLSNTDKIYEISKGKLKAIHKYEDLMKR